MSEITQWWRAFWFAPVASSSLAVLRIAYGSLVVLWTLALAPNLMAFYSRDGIVPEQPGRPWTWGLLELSRSDSAVVVVWVVLLLGALCLTVGFRTRLAALAVFVALYSFQYRNPMVLNAGDHLIRVMAFYMVLAPAGVALSVDRWRRKEGSFWEFPVRQAWTLRLFQVQLSIIYLFTVQDKLRGDAWNDGTAVSYALRAEYLQRFPLPTWISGSLIVSNLLTFGTLALEVALAILVWNRLARPWVLAMGVALHLAIEVTMALGFFSLAMFVLYLAFVPPETMTKLVLAARDRAGPKLWARRERGRST